MNRFDEIRQLLRQRPFQPFRIHLNNGKVLDVVVPEINLIGPKMAVIGLTDPKNPDPFGEGFEIVLLPEVQRVEVNTATGTSS